jgi:hypothetical protein
MKQKRSRIGPIFVILFFTIVIIVLIVFSLGQKVNRTFNNVQSAIPTMDSAPGSAPPAAVPDPNQLRNPAPPQTVPDPDELHGDSKR